MCAARALAVSASPRGGGQAFTCTGTRGRAGATLARWAVWWCVAALCLLGDVHSQDAPTTADCMVDVIFLVDVSAADDTLHSSREQVPG